MLLEQRIGSRALIRREPALFTFHIRICAWIGKELKQIISRVHLMSAPMQNIMPVRAVIWAFLQPGTRSEMHRRGRSLKNIRFGVGRSRPQATLFFTERWKAGSK